MDETSRLCGRIAEDFLKKKKNLNAVGEDGRVCTRAIGVRIFTVPKGTLVPIARGEGIVIPWTHAAVTRLRSMLHEISDSENVLQLFQICVVYSFVVRSEWQFRQSRFHPQPFMVLGISEGRWHGTTSSLERRKTGDTVPDVDECEVATATLLLGPRLLFVFEVRTHEDQGHAQFSSL